MPWHANGETKELPKDWKSIKIDELDFKHELFAQGLEEQKIPGLKQNQGQYPKREKDCLYWRKWKW